ncbi:WD domain, G-beta repeat protein [Pelomyxa schiedti]|nr:WD domain, G-beta repeat protein [Pelomyxa schiedti]
MNSHSRVVSEHDTDMPADCVEFCPEGASCIGGGENAYLACGTYMLLDGDRGKVGRVLFYEVCPSTCAVREVQRVTTPAILDMKWIKTTQKWILVSGCSDGSLVVLGPNTETHTMEIVHKTESQPVDMLLSVDCLPPKSGDDITLTCSQGNGFVSIHKLTDTGPTKLVEWNAHDWQAWIVASHATDKNIVYTGGDDCKLKCWDIRGPRQQMVFTKKKDMGVTSIRAHPTLPLLAVGSYDETIELWDQRHNSIPLASSTGAGGGLWRLKWHPTNPDLLLAACTGNGYSMWQLRESNNTLSCVAEYRLPHTSLAYGVDWCPQQHEGQHLISSCSFYDHKMSLWLHS